MLQSAPSWGVFPYILPVLDIADIFKFRKSGFKRSIVVLICISLIIAHLASGMSGSRNMKITISPFLLSLGFASFSRLVWFSPSAKELFPSYLRTWTAAPPDDTDTTWYPKWKRVLLTQFASNVSMEEQWLFLWTCVLKNKLLC